MQTYTLIRSLYKVIFLILLAAMMTGILYLNKCPVQQATRLTEALKLASSSDIVSYPIEEIVKNPVSIRQDDPKLIKYIRENYLVPPTGRPLNLTAPDSDITQGQFRKVLDILGSTTGLFFVECGAADGETMSNTVYLERKLGWKGLLVEADPLNYEKLATKNRNAWSINACLSPTRNPMSVTMEQNSLLGRLLIGEIASAGSPLRYTTTQCFPFYSILLAVNVTTVDYFSLDVEGLELDVLKTIPWHDVNIKVLTVEVKHVREGKRAVENYMQSVGYAKYGDIPEAPEPTLDCIFVRKDVMPN